MRLHPNAKINLGLFITEKRSDGYHNLESIFIPVAWQDEIDILPAHEFQFSSSGLKIPGTLENNLCVKAYELLTTDFNIPAVHIHLNKQIPMGAGLGGGSADATFVLKGLNEMFELNLNDERLETYAAQLGSDCIFFIKNQAAYVSGRGEKIDLNIDIDAKGWIYMIKPEVFISTQEAYQNVIPKPRNANLKSLVKLPRQEWKNHLTNDFEKSLFGKYPVLGSIKQALYNAGAYYASMSGSGSCVFGLFEEKPTEISHFEGLHSKIVPFSNSL